ncbi:MAG: tetratricopeptide repeat protein [bacterium]
MRAVLLPTLALLLFSGLSSARAGTTDDRLFREGNAAYAHGKYDQARKRYEQIATRFVNDERLYYNLGNTYFRLSQLGRAIWAYERALKLDPNHREARHNLTLARDTVRSRVHDKVVGARDKDRWERLVRFFSVTSAAAWFLALWYLAFGLAGTVILLGPGVLRRSLLGLVLLVGVLAIGFGRLYYDRVQLEDHTRHAIVLDDKVPVREAPQGIATKAFDIHAGLRVEIATREDKWVKIRLSNGLEGWVRSAAIGEL